MVVGAVAGMVSTISCYLLEMLKVCICTYLTEGKKVSVF
jgi:hypothetical protein